MYTASYVPKTTCLYQLNITMPTKEGPMNENHIYGSPLLVQTNTGAAFTPESISFGGYGHCLLWVAAP